MRKKVVIFRRTITILILLFTFYLFIEWNSPVYPPVRRISHARGTPAKLYDFNLAMEDSDIVAHIMIGDWLGEDEQSTYYEAKIIEQFTGDQISEIILRQGGNSNCTYDRFPLFISGNELLVFLKEYTCQETYNTYYRITGGPQTVLHAVIDKNGNAYYLYCSSISLLDPEGVIETLPHDSFTYELYQKLILEDSELSECMRYEYIHFYSREDFLTLIP